MNNNTLDQLSDLKKKTILDTGLDILYGNHTLLYIQDKWDTIINELTDQDIEYLFSLKDKIIITMKDSIIKDDDGIINVNKLTETFKVFQPKKSTTAKLYMLLENITGIFKFLTKSTINIKSGLSDTNYAQQNNAEGKTLCNKIKDAFSNDDVVDGINIPADITTTLHNKIGSVSAKELWDILIEIPDNYYITALTITQDEVNLFKNPDQITSHEYTDKKKLVVYYNFFGTNSTNIMPLLRAIGYYFLSLSTSEFKEFSYLKSPVKQGEILINFDNFQLDTRQKLTVQRFGSNYNKEQNYDIKFRDGELDMNETKIHVPKQKACFLFHGVGTGKTLTSLSIAYTWLTNKHKNEITPLHILCIAPEGLFKASFLDDAERSGVYVYNIRNEIIKLGLDDDAPTATIEKADAILQKNDTEYFISFTGYDYDNNLLKNKDDDTTSNNNGLQWLIYNAKYNIQQQYDVVIFDEAHRLLMNKYCIPGEDSKRYNPENKEIKDEKGIITSNDIKNRTDNKAKNAICDFRFLEFCSRYTKQCILLSGTPMQEEFNNLNDIAFFLNAGSYTDSPRLETANGDENAILKYYNMVRINEYSPDKSIIQNDYKTHTSVLQVQIPEEGSKIIAEHKNPEILYFTNKLSKEPPNILDFIVSLGTGTRFTSFGAPQGVSEVPQYFGSNNSWNIILKASISSITCSLFLLNLFYGPSLQSVMKGLFSATIVAKNLLLTIIKAGETSSSTLANIVNEFLTLIFKPVLNIIGYFIKDYVETLFSVITGFKGGMFRRKFVGPAAAAAVAAVSSKPTTTPQNQKLFPNLTYGSNERIPNPATTRPIIPPRVNADKSSVIPTTNNDSDDESSDSDDESSDSYENFDKIINISNMMDTALRMIKKDENLKKFFDMKEIEKYETNKTKIEEKINDFDKKVTEFLENPTVVNYVEISFNEETGNNIFTDLLNSFPKQNLEFQLVTNLFNNSFQDIMTCRLLSEYINVPTDKEISINKQEGGAFTDVENILKEITDSFHCLFDANYLYDFVGINDISKIWKNISSSIPISKLALGIATSVYVSKKINVTIHGGLITGLAVETIASNIMAFFYNYFKQEEDINLLLKHIKPYISIYNYDHDQYAVPIIENDVLQPDYFNKRLANNGSKNAFPRRIINYLAFTYTESQNTEFSKILMGSDNYKDFEKNITVAFTKQIQGEKCEKIQKDALQTIDNNKLEIQHISDIGCNHTATQIALDIGLETYTKELDESTLVRVKPEEQLNLPNNSKYIFPNITNVDNDQSLARFDTELRFLKTNFESMKNVYKPPVDGIHKRFHHIIHILKVISGGLLYSNGSYYLHPHYVIKPGNSINYYLPVVYCTTTNVMNGFVDYLKQNNLNFLWLKEGDQKMIQNGYKFGRYNVYPVQNLNQDYNNPNPICIILSPPHMEGFSFVHNPALFAPALCDTAGNAEQVYGRVLRKYGDIDTKDGSDLRYDKNIYQYMGTKDEDEKISAEIKSEYLNKTSILSFNDTIQFTPPIQSSYWNLAQEWISRKQSYQPSLYNQLIISTGGIRNNIYKFTSPLLLLQKTSSYAKIKALSLKKEVLSKDMEQNIQKKSKVATKILLGKITQGMSDLPHIAKLSRLENISNKFFKELVTEENATLQHDNTFQPLDIKYLNDYLKTNDKIAFCNTPYGMCINAPAVAAADPLEVPAANATTSYLSSGQKAVAATALLGLAAAGNSYFKKGGSKTKRNRKKLSKNKNRKTKRVKTKKRRTKK